MLSSEKLKAFLPRSGTDKDAYSPLAFYTVLNSEPQQSDKKEIKEIQIEKERKLSSADDMLPHKENPKDDLPTEKKKVKNY